MTKEIKNWEGKVIHCLNCPKPIQCKCIEFDLDLEFGEYEGHYFFCELGGHFTEKWKELIKDRNNYKELYEEFHAKWKKLKYPKEKTGA